MVSTSSRPGLRGAKTRILIADDHEVVRSGTRSILEDHAGWSVVAEAADGKQAVDKAVIEKPDVAILDYSLPLINGLEATRQIHLRVPSVEILIFTVHDNETLMWDLLQAGARGYLLKSDAGQHLITAVETLARHRPYLTAKASKALLEAFLSKSRKVDQVLTARERAVVQLVADGYTSKEIANILNISFKTVETHRATIMRKLDLNSSAALVRYAVRNRIVEM
ncbi:MAG TPA: response regulator transcription factor [Hyphomicrobiaceae bacterium]|nr:response regulator transcription factor [Hyphomicrobiaceae bacterium]